MDSITFVLHPTSIVFYKNEKKKKFYKWIKKDLKANYAPYNLDTNNLNNIHVHHH